MNDLSHLRDLGSIRYDAYTEEAMARLPRSNKEARDNGVSLFFTGRPCLHGHTSPRYTKGGTCVACARVNNGHSVIGITAAKRAVRISNAERTTYVPLVPCKHGHSLRYTASNNCVECDKITRDRHRISDRYRRIKKEYGLAKADYLALVEKQNGSCLVCEEKPESHFSLHVDHCHDTGVVRGLLCQRCNQALGLMRNDPELLRGLANYVEA